MQHFKTSRLLLLFFLVCIFGLISLWDIDFRIFGRESLSKNVSQTLFGINMNGGSEACPVCHDQNDSCKNEAVKVRSLEPSCNEKFIYFYLQSADRSRGIGNIVFEILAALGVARTLGRAPMLNGSHPFVGKRILKLTKAFPNILEPFSIGFTKTGTYVDYHYPGCCKMSNMTEVIAAYNDTVVSTYIQFHQALSYWKNYKREEVLHLLDFHEDDKKIAREEMIEEGKVNETYNVCVHVRRGDFVKTGNLLESSENFTILSTKYVIDEVRILGKTNISLIVIGNDPKWEEEIFRKANLSISILKSDRSWPSHIDWVFSRMWCDTVIQTASASTYGAMIAYLSRGQHIYYNKDFSKPGGVEREVDVRERFAPEWKRIGLVDGVIEQQDIE